LAQCAYAWLVINDKKNKHNVKLLEEAMKNYSERWARIQAKYAPRKPAVQLIQVLDRYSNETGISKDEICGQIEWNSFYPAEEQEWTCNMILVEDNED